MAVPKHYNICCNDILQSINDMINTFVTTGRLIIDAEGIRNMHLANLAYDHAIGKWNRTLNKQIINSFKECEELRLAMCQMIKYIYQLGKVERVD